MVQTLVTLLLATQHKAMGLGSMFNAMVVLGVVHLDQAA
jgi:hypothetical protein